MAHKVDDSEEAFLEDLEEPSEEEIEEDLDIFEPLEADAWKVTGEPDPVRLYFQEMARTPLLSAEEEVELARLLEAGRKAEERLKGNGKSLTSEEFRELTEIVAKAQVARDHLIRANTRLVVGVAKRYRGWGIPFEDLIQEGNIGLMRAVDRFDHEKGYKFSTYATWWIRQAITRALADQGRTIRLPVHIGEEVRRLRQAEEQLSERLGREPTLQELAAETGLPTRRIRWLRRVSRRPVSLETSVGAEENDSSLADFVADENAPSPTDSAALEGLREEIRQLLDQLEEREAAVLRLRYGFVDGKPHTLKEVGERLGVTRERVRQIEAKALRRLRHPFRSKRIRDFVHR
ncbi:MAG: sigma-70 family RNA polymerase sigma factor [Anaerolineae bacterium]